MRTPAVPPPGERPRGRSPGEVLTAEECRSLLRSATVARLAFVVDGWPVVLPVNCALDSNDVVIRTDPGTKLASTRGGAQVAVQIDSTNALYRLGWSVLVSGMADEVTDRDELARLASLPLAPWAGGDKLAWIRVRPVQVTGRRLPRSWRYPDRPR